MQVANRQLTVTDGLTTRDVQRLIGQALGRNEVTDRHIRDLRIRGQLTGYTVGRLRRYTRAEVEAYITTHLASDTEPPVGAGLAA